jgi:hypothetical protein
VCGGGASGATEILLEFLIKKKLKQVYL